MDRRTYLKSSLAVGGSLLLPAGVLGLVGCSGTTQPPELVGFNGKIMGTGYSVRLGVHQGGDDTLSEDALRGLAQRVHEALQLVDAHMSTWRDDSEISLFNNSVDIDWQAMTPATMNVLAQARNTSVLSDGAFDVTIGPVVDLWGFGAGAAKINGQVSNQKPTAQLIRETLAGVGYEAIDVDIDRRAIRKLEPNVQVDLSGIAKGYAVDVVANLLMREGFNSYLMEVGGELLSRGRKPDGMAWKVAIEKPSDGRRDVFRVLELDGRAVATSGDYRNFFIDGGQRYSHSIDPRTGESVRHELASVSVVADTSMKADALSTAMMIMGPTTAMDFAQLHGIAAHLIVKSGRALEEVYSPALEPLLV